MKLSKTSSCALLLLVIATVARTPRLRADNPFAPNNSPAPQSTATKNPDAEYAVASDMCSGLPLPALVDQSKSGVTYLAKSAIDQLRAAGPAGLDALMSAYKDEIDSRRNAISITGRRSSDTNDSRWAKISADLDAVAAQHDAYVSGMYWYTDFRLAQAAARSAGKPILSLRLLGNLSDEYSCANSRFFRTVLYANSEVGACPNFRGSLISMCKLVLPVSVP